MKQELPVTVAIVDDNALIRESVKYQLSALGYRVVLEAENGKEFLDKLDCSTTLDICVMDINMPVMDGLEATLHLKKNRPSVKVIFFSTEDISVYAAKGKELGADGFVVKEPPFSDLNIMLSTLTKREQVA